MKEHSSLLNRTLMCVLVFGFSIVSSASTVCSGSSENSALVILDMQPEFVTRNGYDKNPKNKVKAKQVIEEQIAAIKHAKKAGIPIIFLEYEDFGDTNANLKAAVANYPEVKYFMKNSEGIFEDNNDYRQDLINYIKKKQIGTLIVTGANGGACVERSINDALKNNCSVVAFSKGIADFNFKDFIYPYRFFIEKPDCRDCTFKEVSDADGIVEFMVTRSGSSSPMKGGASGNIQ